MRCGYGCVVVCVEGKGCQLINIETATNVTSKVIASEIGKVIAYKLALTSTIIHYQS